jgi:prepilin-type N-terminal cleavage/methylation domain-containing protein
MLRNRTKQTERDRIDCGFSLVEVIAAIALVGLMGIALLNASATGIRVSSSTDTIAKVETILSNAADRINRAPLGCDYTQFAQAAAQSEGWLPNAATVAHQYYEPGPSAVIGDEGTWQAGACPGGIRRNRLVQMVTVTVTTPNGKTQRSIQVVKSEI